MESATEPNFSNLRGNAWHFIHDDGSIYYVTNETKMPNVEELVGLKPDGTSVLKKFLNNIKIEVFSLTKNEKFAVDSTQIPNFTEIIEDSVLYCPGQQYASCIDCCVLCDVKTKCPSCHRRVLVARILKQPESSAGSVVESSDMEISEDIIILPDVSNSGLSASLPKQEEQDKHLNTESTFSAQVDLHPITALAGPSNVKNTFFGTAPSKILRPPETSSANQELQAKKTPREAVTACSSQIQNVSGESEVEFYEPAAKKSKLGSIAVTTFNISCRSIRIGSYALEPVEPIILSPESVIMKVPPINPQFMTVKLILLRSDLLSASLYLAKKLLILYIEVTEPVAAQIRENLQMRSADLTGPWFNPNSSNPAHRKIVLYLKDCHSADTINSIKQLLKTMRIYKSSSAGEISLNLNSMVENRPATSSSSNASPSTSLSKKE